MLKWSYESYKINKESDDRKILISHLNYMYYQIIKIYDNIHRAITI